MSSGIDSEDFIASLYDAALEPEQWAGIFLQLRNAINANTSLFSILHEDTRRTKVLACNAPEAFVRGYAQIWWRDDLWAAAGSRNPDRILVGSEVVPDSQFVRSPLYNEFVKQTSDIRDTLGVVFDVAGWRAVIGFHRPLAGTFGASERQLLAPLLPHLRRSLLIALRYEDLAQKTATAQAILDTVSFGLVVVNSKCVPLVVNRFAQRLLDIGDGLVCGAKSPVLEARRPQDNLRLHRQVAAVAARAAAPGGGLRIARTSGDPSYIVLVVPVTAAKAELFHTTQSAALLIIQDPARVPVPMSRLLTELYALTSAEADLCDRLATGARLEDIAERRGVRISTLRTQLSQILAKTGTTRQAELLSLLARLQSVS